jgi:4-amino-4-deoxy-L-arabinose transferase-like glycosyltransferase
MKKFLNFLKTNPRLIFIIWVVFLGFFLRVFRLPDFISYHQDQVRDLFYVQNNFEQGKMILLGPKASVGDFFLPPFWYYLMNLGFIFSPSPVVPAFIVALLSSLTVLLIYFFCEKFFSQKVAIFASLFYAVSPLSIEYSRFAWNPNPIPFFTMATFYFLYVYIYKQKYYGLILGTITANLALQLHYQGMVILAFFVLVLFVTKKLSIKQFGKLIVINLILFLPFFIHEYTNNFENTKGIISFLFKTQSGSGLKFFGIPFFIKFIFRDFSTFIGETLFFKNHMLGFIGFLILSFSLVFTKSKMSSIKLLRCFLIFSFVMLFFYKNSLINFYLLFLIPIVIIYLTIIINDFLPEKITTVILFLIVLLNLYFSPAFIKNQSAYIAIKNAVDIIAKNENYCPSYRIFDQNYIQSKYRYLFSINKNRPVSSNCDLTTYFQSNPKVKNVFYICEAPLCSYEFVDFSQFREISQKPFDTGVRIYKLE